MTTPASRVKSTKWFVRVDGSEEFLRQKCRELSTCLDVTAMLSAYHTGKTKENPHCHFVIEITSEVQKQSFAVRIKSLFGIVKKTQYALDVWDGHRTMGACSYLWHEEDAKMLVNMGFTDEELVSQHEANQAVQAVVAVNAERASNKLVNRALTEFAGSTDHTRIDILKYMVKLIKAGEIYHPGEFRLRQYVEEVDIRLMADDDIDTYVNHLANKFWG